MKGQECTDFADDAGKQAVGLFCIVADCFFISITKLLKICNMYNFFFIYLSTIRLLFNSANGYYYIFRYNNKILKICRLWLYGYATVIIG